MRQARRPSLPVVLAAFGSTRARKAYSFLAAEVAELPGVAAVRTAFSSRMVRSFTRAKGGNEAPPSPARAVEEFAAEGYRWVAVQSVHILAGHEFYRLVEEMETVPARTVLGLPLLWSREDYGRLASLLVERHRPGPSTAVVFVGHGTDHAAWSTYPALEHTLRAQGMANAWVGVVDGDPGPEEVADQVARAGHRRAVVVPLMLVAGLHFMEDIVGDDPGSYCSAFRERGIEVTAVREGLLELEGVRRIFADHISQALDCAPISGSGAGI